MCLWGLCGGGGVRGLLRALGSRGIISSPPWPFPGNLGAKRLTQPRPLRQQRPREAEPVWPEGAVMPWLPEQVSRPWGTLLLGALTAVKGREAAGSECMSCSVTYSKTLDLSGWAPVSD